MANHLELGNSQISLFKDLSPEMSRIRGGGQEHSNEELANMGTEASAFRGLGKCEEHHPADNALLAELISKVWKGLLSFGVNVGESIIDARHWRSPHE